MRWLAAVGRASIWHRHAIPASEGEASREVKQYVLPAIDVLLIVGCLLGLDGGLPTFTIVYGPVIAGIATHLVLMFAVGCLIGVAFPRMWVLELVCKCGLAVMLMTYALLLFNLSTGPSPARGFVSGVCAAVCVVLAWRIIWLSRDFRRRRATRRAIAGLRG